MHAETVFFFLIFSYTNYFYDRATEKLKMKTSLALLALVASVSADYYDYYETKAPMSTKAPMMKKYFNMMMMMGYSSSGSTKAPYDPYDMSSDEKYMSKKYSDKSMTDGSKKYSDKSMTAVPKKYSDDSKTGESTKYSEKGTMGSKSAMAPKGGEKSAMPMSGKGTPPKKEMSESGSMSMKVMKTKESYKSYKSTMAPKYKSDKYDMPPKSTKAPGYMTMMMMMMTMGGKGKGVVDMTPPPVMAPYKEEEEYEDKKGTMGKML